ncbi:FG-GAP repeat domain-containing protein, partial [Streptomyces sp. NPDC056121]|uniref:FG-GAP repeat domain-containing protein n=1 Tax=Streptomyces sp. NPDC056121 TaxID=3345718 RepID=UPI0035E2517D
MYRSPRRHLTPDGRSVAAARGHSRRVPTLILAVATALLASSPASATVAKTTRFGTAVNLDDSGRGSSAVAIGDLNNDGKPDLVTAIRTEGLGVFLGSGGGSYGAVTKY